MALHERSQSTEFLFSSLTGILDHQTPLPVPTTAISEGGAFLHSKMGLRAV